MDDTAVDKALSTLSNLADQRRHLEQQIRDLIDHLRSEDFEGRAHVSWTIIAMCLGVTRQSAHHRYGRF